MMIEDGVLVKVEENEAKGHFVVSDGVKKIGEGAFNACSGLKTVSIPDSVTSIGDEAFSRCTGLTSVTIPDSVRSIGVDAFQGCSGLTSVTIGNSATSIGVYAFYNCTSLTSVTIPDSVTSIGNGAFSYCPDAIFEIIGGVKYIGNWAIAASDPSITRVTLRDGTIGIADDAFSRYAGLTSVTIPDSVTSIGAWAFEGCTGLTSVAIPDSVTSIGMDAFYGCSRLKSKVSNYKAFKITPSGELKCLTKIYKEGSKSFVRGDLKLCKNGIHYCTNIFELFNHYEGEIDKDIAVYECDVSEETVGAEESSVRCARWIIPHKRLFREDVIRILNGGE